MPVVGGDIRFDVGSGRVWLEASNAEPEVYGYRARDPQRDGDTPEELDAAGHALRSVTSPEGEVTTRSYDARGHIDTIEYPTGGVEVRTYDTATGYEDTRTLAHGTTLSYTRDATGRELERRGSDGSLRSTTYGPSDRMETATDDTGTTTYEYDAPGRWTGLTYPTGGTWARAHDAADRVTSVTTTAPGAATGHETEYLYDDANRLTRIIDPLGGNTVFTYDAAGRLDTRTLPNGVVTTWTYDVRSRVDTITHRRADTTIIASVDYERSDSGEPTRIDREDGTYVLLGYDAALRLTSEAYHDATDTLLETITYTYDRDGNRTSRTTSAGEETYAYTSGSRLTGITRGGADLATYTYDDAGRVLTRRYDARDQTLSWDADDHVVALSEGTTELAYDFDAAGRRVRREERVSGAVVDVDRWQVAPTGVDELESPHLETDDTGAEQRAWVFAGEHPLLRYDPATGEGVYYLSDAMGSVIGLVDDVGATGTVQYDGFGNERVVSGTLASIEEEGDFRFQGMWLDGDSGLYYVRARVYEAGTGRFLSRDLAEGVRTGADTYWTYAFAGNNPAVFVDPSGESYDMAGLSAVNAIATILAVSALALISSVLTRVASESRRTSPSSGCLEIVDGILLEFVAGGYRVLQEGYRTGPTGGSGHLYECRDESVVGRVLFVFAGSPGWRMHVGWWPAGAVGRPTQTYPNVFALETAFHSVGGLIQPL